ncbi:hypothetical protein HHK36_012070 [Tetracentron sinense]|uniref:SOSEKI DIX-like domain-containing protein n=1 Tax=Tetracentron sinense TaxID=13715 RepID=A0A834ZC23_TETSI|nr:hypothetical protein HHK36_012070 [Tetracentron sinense]
MGFLLKRRTWDGVCCFCRRMEAKAVGVGEVRRVHIIYFLSRMGRIEQPHLIRVHHLSRNGVHLRDVKRWLSDLRGKDMPDSFAWSYKRRYKAGYVWQDLLEDDLITPISDNEYVLKGSEIFATPFGPCSYDDKKLASINQKPPPLEVEDEHHQSSKEETIQVNPETKTDISTKSSSEIDEESGPFDSETSTLTEDSIKLEDERYSKTSKQEIQEASENYSSPSYLSLLRKKKNTEKTKSPSPSSSSFAKSKSYSSGASQVFRNLLTCGAVDTKDSALVMVNRVKKTSMKSSNKHDTKAEILAGSGTGRIFGSVWNQQRNSPRKSSDGVKSSKTKSESKNQKTVSAVFKPVGGPNCSQCGKEFKPEKMHTHMKSCRGLKALAKNDRASAAAAAAAAAAEKRSQSSKGTSSKEVMTGYLLTH